MNIIKFITSSLLTPGCDVKIAKSMLDIREMREKRMKIADESVRKGDARPHPARGSIGHLISALLGEEFIR